MNEDGRKGYVIDTSVAVKWFLPEDFTKESLFDMDEEIIQHAPDYLTLEASSALLKRCRRRPMTLGSLTVSESRSVIALIHAFPYRHHPVEPLVELAFDLSLEVGSSFYDGLFLALALQIAAKLVTADRKFYEKLAASNYAAQTVWVGSVP